MELNGFFVIFVCLQCLAVLDACMDIIPDSQERGQCYIPLEYLTDDEYKLLTQERNPYQVGPKVLKQYVDRLIGLYKKLQAGSVDAIKLFPDDVQRYALTLILLMIKIGDVIQKNPVYERDINISKLDLFFIVLKGMYFGNLYSL